MAGRIAGGVRRAARRLIGAQTQAEQAATPHIRVSELVARQFATGGYRRLDLFVMSEAIADAETGRSGGLDLLQKLLHADSVRRDTDTALLALLRRGPLSASTYVPAPAVVDPDLQLLANAAGLAAAIQRGDTEMPVKIWRPRRSPSYDTSWLRERGFTSGELERVEVARTQAYGLLGLADLPWKTISAAQHELRRHLDPADRMHGLGGFYQSCEELAIPGQRPTKVRFAAYALESLLDPGQRLLDIGCNCGFLALHCAPHVREVHGFDINPRFIAIADAAARVLGRQNCHFSVSSFDEYSSAAPYDLIFSFAVHHWIGEPIPMYAERLRQLLKPGGLILIESQDVSTHDVDWDARLNAFCGAGYEQVRAGTLCDDGVRTRRHVLLRDSRI